MARELSEATKLIHKMLDKNPELTWKDAEPILKEKGIEISSSNFGVKKHSYLNAGKESTPRKRASKRSKVVANVGSTPDVIATIKRAGGLTAYQERLAKAQARLTDLQSRVSAEQLTVAEMEANVATFVSLSESIAAAS